MRYYKKSTMLFSILEMEANWKPRSYAKASQTSPTKFSSITIQSSAFLLSYALTTHCGISPGFQWACQAMCWIPVWAQESVSKAASQIKNPSDRVEAYCAGLGEDVMIKIMDANLANYHQRDCLIHSDSRVFNMLVEAKPSIVELEDFGPNGTVVLCDREMAMSRVI